MLKSRIAVNLIVVFLGILMPVSISFAEYTFEDIAGLWLFDEGEGAVATDSSQNENNGTIHGATWVDGRFGNALQFDGTSNWIEVPHADSLGFPAGTSFSITLHYKGTRVGGSLVGKNYEDTTQQLPWYLIWNGGSGNTISLYLRNSSSANSRINGTINVSDDEWHFIAAVADADSGMISLWVDGEMDLEGALNTTGGYGTSEGVFHIGRHANRYTTGIIDEVALFNVALSEDDLQSIMNDGLVNLTAVEATGKLATTWGNVKKRTIE